MNLHVVSSCWSHQISGFLKISCNLSSSEVLQSRQPVASFPTIHLIHLPSNTSVSNAGFVTEPPEMTNHGSFQPGGDWGVCGLWLADVCRCWLLCNCPTGSCHWGLGFSCLSDQSLSGVLVLRKMLHEIRRKRGYGSKNWGFPICFFLHPMEMFCFPCYFTKCVLNCQIIIRVYWKFRNCQLSTRDLMFLLAFNAVVPVFFSCFWFEHK